MSAVWPRVRKLPYLLNAAYLAASIGLLLLVLRSYSLPRSMVMAKAAVLVLVVVGLLGLLALGGERSNAAACLAASALLGWGQWRLSARRVAEYPAGPTRRPAPYVMFSGAPGELDHNELGYRGELPSREKAADEFRILVLGGSAVYGSGPPQLTIPDQLQELVQGSGRPRVRVFNWGVVSQVSGQELATLALRAPRYAPDLVVLYGGGNDISGAYTYDPRPGYPFNFTLQQSAIDVFQEGDKTALLSGAFTQSNLLRVLFGPELADAIARLPPVRRKVGYLTPRWEEAVGRTYLENVESACRLGGAFGFRVAVVLQPLVYFTPKADAYRGVPPDFRPYAERQYQRIREGFALLSRRQPAERCLFADLSRVCARGECEFQDLIHPTPETRRPIAEAVSRELEGAGLLPRAARASD